LTDPISIRKAELRLFIREAVAEEIPKAPAHCPAQDLTVEQVIMLTRMVRAIDGVAVNVGRGMVMFVMAVLLGLLSLGFWERLK
jgi:hypothetical protein